MVKKPKFELKNKHSNQKHVVKFYIFFIKCDGVYFNHAFLMKFWRKKQECLSLKNSEFHLTSLFLLWNLLLLLPKRIHSEKNNFWGRRLLCNWKLKIHEFYWKVNTLYPNGILRIREKKTNTKNSSDLIKLVIIVSEQF